MFDQPRQSDIPTSRPLSCPPPEVPTEFSTPVRPVRRRRPVSSFDTPTSRQSPATSPIGTPSLLLTPSPQFFSSNQHSPCTPNDWNINHPNQCQFCLFTFKNQTYLKNHDKCLFKPNTLHLRVNKISPTVLTRPKNWKETLGIINQLCQEDIVNLCILQSWSLPSFYPFCFPHHIRSGRVGGVPVIEEMTASRFSAPLLRRLLETAEEVSLPKNIIVKDEETGQVAYLPQTVLTPTSDFSLTESSECFLVRKST